MGQTSIEWCDHSVNPIRARYAPTDGNGHYCEKVSPGCTHCYASRLQPRFGMPAFQEQRGLQVKPYLHEPALGEVLSRKKPTRYFWCDMSDLFGAWVPDAWIDQCFAVMALTPQHTHLVLTKRADRMRQYVMGLGRSFPRLQAACPEGWSLKWSEIPLVGWPLPNVWLGVSVENQHFADERIPLLLQTPAAVRFISAEPLLGPLILGGIHVEENADETTLDWVIVGGESGHGSRPMNMDWARAIVAQCHAAGVACFVKQLGAKPFEPYSDGTPFAEPDYKSRKGGDPAEWPADLRVREFPSVSVPA